MYNSVNILDSIEMYSKKWLRLYVYVCLFFFFFTTIEKKICAVSSSFIVFDINAWRLAIPFSVVFVIL